jgi:hypothetical protein
MLAFSERRTPTQNLSRFDQKSAEMARESIGWSVRPEL